MHENLIGLKVTDESTYQAYREAMMPILTRYGGGFRIDLDVALVRSPEGVEINRLFIIHFPDRKTQDAFFAILSHGH